MRAKLRKVSNVDHYVKGDILDEELKDLNREERSDRAVKLKELRLKRKELEVEQEVASSEKKLKEIKGGGSQTGLAKIDMSPQMIQVLASIPDEQRDKIVTSLMMLNSRGGGGGNDPMSMMYLLPMMTGFMKANPTASQADANKTAEIMINSLKSGFEMARQVNQPPQQTDALGIMKMMSDLWGGTIGQRLEVLVSNLKPEPNIFTEILTKPDVFNNVKQFFGGGQPQEMSPELAFQMEKLRTERDIAIANINVNDRRWMAEHNASMTGDAQKIGAVERILAGPIGGMISQFGQAGANRLQGQGGMPLQQQGSSPQPRHQEAQLPLPIPSTHLVQCAYDDCGQQFNVSEGVLEFTCPNCGKALRDNELLARIQEEEEARKKIMEASRIRMMPKPKPEEKAEPVQEKAEEVAPQQINEEPKETEKSEKRDTGKDAKPKR